MSKTKVKSTSSCIILIIKKELCKNIPAKEDEVEEEWEVILEWVKSDCGDGEKGRIGKWYKYIRNKAIGTREQIVQRTSLVVRKTVWSSKKLEVTVFIAFLCALLSVFLVFSVVKCEEWRETRLVKWKVGKRSRFLGNCFVAKFVWFPQKLIQLLLDWLIWMIC